jgi:hypothetical protein
MEKRWPSGRGTSAPETEVEGLEDLQSYKKKAVDVFIDIPNPKEKISFAQPPGSNIRVESTI